MPAHIASKFTGYTALSGTTAQTLGGADLELPDGAKCILAVIPYITSPAGNTAAESVMGKVTITSADIKQGINPLQILAPPIGSSLLKGVAQPQGHPNLHIYPVNCPVNGGENLTIQGTGLIDHTIEPYMGCEVIYSDVAPHKAQRFYKLGTLTATGTAAATVPGSNISVQGGKYSVELFGFAVGTTVAALKGLSGYLYFTSEGWTPAWQQYLPICPASGLVDTNIVETIAGVARRKICLDMMEKTTIEDNFHLSVALTTAGYWIAGIGYTRSGDLKPI